MFKIITLIYGLLFGILDSLALPIVKGVSLGWNKWLMIFPILLYACSPLIFLQSLKTETLTIMNLVWDLSSDIIVTLIGLLIFSEKISPIKLLGVISGFVSLLLLSYDNQTMNGFLAEKFNLTSSIFE